MIGEPGTTGAAKAVRLACALALTVACATACNSGGARGDASGSDAAAGAGGPFGGGGHDAAPAGLSCGGHADVVGSASAFDGGAFSGTLVRADVVERDCDDPPGSVELRLIDPGTFAQFQLRLAASADGGIPALVGSHVVRALIEPPGQPVRQTSATLIVTAASDPDTVTSQNAPMGELRGTVSITSDGVTISGSFSTPYCGTLRCVFP